MLDDAAPSRSNEIDPAEAPRKRIEAEEETASKRKEAAVRAMAKPAILLELEEDMGASTAVEDGEEDYLADIAASFRLRWEARWLSSFGSFEDTTLIPAMRYTDEPPVPQNKACSYMHTLNVFSIKLAGVHRDLRWPLHVFGLVAARDYSDHNRNLVFHRTRDNPQIVHQEDPYLELTGPVRGIVAHDTTDFEVVLKVKGSDESEDKDLSFLLVRYVCGGMERSPVINRIMTSKLSTLKFTFGHIVRSVEATVSMKVINGSWPDGSRGVFTASTASIDHMKFSLLDSRGGRFPVGPDGMIVMSRHVVCVELDGELRVSVVARDEDQEETVDLNDDTVFTPMKAGRSRDILKIGCCEIEVTVAWSVFSSIMNVRGKWAGASSSSPPGICDYFFSLQNAR